MELNTTLKNCAGNSCSAIPLRTLQDISGSQVYHRRGIHRDTDHYNASTTLFAVLLIVSTLSLFGALSIILSSSLARSFRYFRHRLILGLAISDALLTCNFIVTNTLGVAGYSIGDQENSVECRISGFLTQMFVVQTDCWALVIAVCTFFLLGWGGRKAAWIRAHPVVIWCIPWIVSVLSAGLCLLFIGYGDVGGWCWLIHDHTHLLINYIPRWTIITTITSIYISLFYFIHKSTNYDAEDVVDLEFLHRARARESDYIRGGDESFAECPIQHQADRSSLRRASMRMMLYPMAYTLIWVIPTGVHIYHAAGDVYGTSDAVTMLEKACVAGQGLAHAIVYSCTEQLWQTVADNWQGYGGVDELPWNRDVELSRLAPAHGREP